MPRKVVSVTVFVKSYVKQIKQHVNQVLENRLDAVSQQMAEALKQTVSKKGPSHPGEPPGITRTPHSERVPGGLMKSMQWKRGRKRLVRHIGTPLPRGFWMEMGVHGGKLIRPIRAKALLVPLSRGMGQRLAKRFKVNKGGGKGRRGRRKSSLNKSRNGLLGVVQKPTGEWFALRSFVIQGPIAPRPWLKPTFFKNLRKIGLTLSQKIY